METQLPKNLGDRVAVVTGASSGIGEATAKALAARGARVAVLARRKERLDGLVAEIHRVGGRAAAWTLDVTDRRAVEAVAATILSEFGRVDIVVNNAGVMLPNPIEAIRADQWQKQIDLNISGLMNVIGAFTPALIKAGAGGGPADLVNISSIAGRNIFPSFAVYSGTKAFVTHLSITLRAELGAKGVRVSAVEPGVVGTELLNHVDCKGVQDWFEASKSHMEWLRSEDVAETIAFIVSAPRRVNLQLVTIMPTGQAM
ncbi:MAG: SDR family oxidoreductase [Phycisphaerae bacterium]|nr:SDR family oxidoreductase [Phycisphaerae bacterium]